MARADSVSQRHSSSPLRASPRPRARLRRNQPPFPLRNTYSPPIFARPPPAYTNTHRSLYRLDSRKHSKRMSRRRLRRNSGTERLRMQARAPEIMVSSSVIIPGSPPESLWVDRGTLPDRIRFPGLQNGWIRSIAPWCTRDYWRRRLGAARCGREIINSSRIPGRAYL